MALFKVGDNLLCINKPDFKTTTNLEVGETYECLGIFGDKIAIHPDQLKNTDGFFDHRFVLATELNKALF
jgi:hypothetical protein